MSFFRDYHFIDDLVVCDYIKLNESCYSILTKMMKFLLSSKLFVDKTKEEYNGEEIMNNITQSFKVKGLSKQLKSKLEDLEDSIMYDINSTKHNQYSNINILRIISSLNDKLDIIITPKSKILICSYLTAMLKDIMFQAKFEYENEMEKLDENYEGPGSIYYNENIEIFQRHILASLKNNDAFTVYFKDFN